MPSRTIVVVGGAVGGPTAARAARAEDPEARIVLLERAERLNPLATAFASAVAGETRSEAEAAAELSRSLKRDHEIQVRTGQEVTALDPKAKRLVANGKRLRWDALVWAAGAESVLPRVAGLKLEGRDPAADNVARLRTSRDLERIEAVRAAGGRRATVLGGGYLGVEAADALARAGFEVTLLERGPRLLPELGEWTSARAADGLRELGVRVRTGVDVRRARLSRGRVTSLEPARGRALELDLLVVAVGVRPRADAPAAAGAAVDPDGALLLDAHAATSLPGVFACGVCAAVPQAVSGRSKWSAQASVADKTAAVAGACAAGADRRLAPMTESAVVRAGGTVVGRAGLSASEARAHAPGAVVEVQVERPALDPQLTRSPSLSVALRCHRESGRLLGGEIAGTEGVDKRVDVLATALAAGLDTARLAQLDLGYSPTLSVLHDPLNAAAEAAERARRAR